MGKAYAFPICKSEVRAVKRIIPLILALLLLAACGEQAASGTPALPPSAETFPATSGDPTAPEPTPSPAVTVSPEEASRRPVPDTMILPDTGFEPESYWLAEPFGDSGQSLLLIAGNGQFKCWYNCRTDEFNTGWDDIVGGSFTDSEAAASVDGETLALEYYDASDTPRPARFTAITRDEALRAHRDMPYNDEISLPLPEIITRAEWEATPGVTPVSYVEDGVSGAVYEYMGSQVMYDTFGDALLRLGGFVTESPEFPFKVRGVGIGSSGEDVLASFPSNVPELSDAEEHHALYGGVAGLLGSWNAMDENRGGPDIMFSDSKTITHFILDADGMVCKIEFWNSAD